ncbi:MAG: hypothetical protein JSV61_04445 [Anaerolineales bacterium]|nr:MAG: hypothetical protein JSV61_04445 [Anaerolineales bacterium]
MKVHRYLLFLAVIVVVGQGWIPTVAQSSLQLASDQRYFPETGHWVVGEFLATYESAPDPAKVYGNPITEAYQEATGGRYVQYFERARFELVPDNPAEFRVKITLLGELIYTPGQELKPSANLPACQVFVESGKQICYAFLDFFEANGGAAQFGYPISNFEIQDGLIVQYFQRARFEWHPELPPGKRVTLTNLGYQYFYFIRENPKHLRPVPGPESRLNPMVQTVLGVRARAFVQQAVLPQSGSQTIYIIVQDQRPLPLSDAEVTLTITWPSKTKEQLIIGDLTNGMGILTHTISYSNQPVGPVEIVATVTYNGFQTQTATSFRIWY